MFLTIQNEALDDLGHTGFLRFRLQMGAVINIPQQIPYEYGDIPIPAQGKTCVVSKINIDYPGEW